KIMFSKDEELERIAELESKDNFTDSTRGLLNRMHLVLIKHIAAKERQLELYKDLDSLELIDLATTELLELKADLEQLKNL
ncbi:unnamed protein product, partial [marine sediment metagenome]